MVEFRILGPVEAVEGGSALTLGGPRHRRLLAVLLLRAGQVVPASTLMEALWGESVPRSAAAILHVRVSELRSALREAGARLLTRGGYMLRLDRDELDAWRFERLASAGASALAEGDARRASTDLQDALALWRGPALMEFASEPFARSDTARLEELRWRALEHRITADLELGRHADVIAELEQLVAEQPLRERYWTQLMLARYRDGRQGEALLAYQTARTHLAEQLGVDPGYELQQMYQAILAGDEWLEPRRDASAHSAFRAPAQLPADVTAFTGRTAELSKLDELVAESSSAMVISAVSGTAGVGKTALALHWAHRVRDRFPDGQLYTDLRGYDPLRPVPPGEALAQFLRALGIADKELPGDVEERAALYRTLLAGRRVLVVLDNASSADQIRPLLPGTPTSLALVTSRDSLPALVARHGAHRVDLDLLAEPDAFGLLRKLIGDRVEAEPDAARTLVALCARLPLALRITAELAISRGRTRLSTLATELGDHQRRLELLEAGGDPRTAVRAVFSWSYQRLPPGAARLFRLLGLHPGTDLHAEAVAALAGAETGAAEPLLELLVRAHLVHRTGPGRYGMHDLLRAYAAHLADTVDSAAERDAGRTRLLDYYREAAERHGQRWLDTERSNLCAIVGFAAGNGWHGHATDLAAALWPALDNAGHYAEAVTIFEAALQAAASAADRGAEHRVLCHLGQVHMRLGRYALAVGYLRRGLALGRAIGPGADPVQAVVLTLLGITHLWQGRYATAERHIRRARDLCRAIGDAPGEARAVGTLGQLFLRQGRYDDAEAHLRQALTIVQACGDRIAEARALGNLAQVAMRQHRFGAAVEHLTRALVLFRETGHRRDEAAAINGLGEMYSRQGRLDLALRHHLQALDAYRELGDRGNEGIALHGVGEVHRARGDLQSAVSVLRQALAVFEQVGDRPREVLVRNTLGETLTAAGDDGPARAEHTAALDLAAKLEDRFELGRAHTGLARLDRAARETEPARWHYEQALAHYKALGVPEEAMVREELVTMT